MDIDTKNEESLVLAFFYVFDKWFFTDLQIIYLLFLLETRLRAEEVLFRLKMEGDVLVVGSVLNDVLMGLEKKGFLSARVGSDGKVMLPGRLVKDKKVAKEGFEWTVHGTVNVRKELAWLVETFRGWSSSELQRHAETFYCEGFERGVRICECC